jgi:hypothetical protein
MAWLMAPLYGMNRYGLNIDQRVVPDLGLHVIGCITAALLWHGLLWHEDRSASGVWAYELHVIGCTAAAIWRGI